MQNPTVNPSVSVLEVQACISSVSFPTSMDGLRETLRWNAEYGRPALDMDILLRYDPDKGSEWTGPRWLTTGDVMFFYHTKSAKDHINRLVRELRATRPGVGDSLGRLLALLGYVTKEELVNALHHALELAARYSGTIFACARVGGTSELVEDISRHSHFKSRVAVPLAQVHVFESPLPPGVVEQCVRIQRAGAVTIIGRREFDEIRSQLAAANQIPEFLSQVQFTDRGFQQVNQSNWPSISCAAGSRFRLESQIRSYLLDFLLNEVKDANTPLLLECTCLRDGCKTGTVDYFVQVHGRWIPVEAKLNVLSEMDIESQIERYIHIDSFSPTIGSTRRTMTTDPDSSVCLVVDQFGVYVTVNGSFEHCQPGRPVWLREQMSHQTAHEIRQRMQTLM